MIVRTLAVGALGAFLLAPPLHGEGGPRYRDFQLGGDLASVSALAGAGLGEIKVIHERPALLQDLEWRQPYAPSDLTAAPKDPVQQIVFSFYNDQLFRLVVDYDRDRTEGMTDADMIEALSSAYGPRSTSPSKPRAGASQVAEESGTRLARWGDAAYSVDLYRASYASGFRLIVTSLRLDALARTAEAQALRMDSRDAPKREIARQKKEADDTRALQQKARIANKAGFRP
jgi:hypothetical protein